MLFILVGAYIYHRRSHDLPLNPFADISRYSSYENFGYGSRGEVSYIQQHSSI